MDLRVHNYRIGRKIGSGSFGDVFIGEHVETGKRVAIKLESTKARHQHLLHECQVYKYLGGAPGFARLLWHGHQHEYNCMAVDLLGPSLEQLFNYCSRKFSLKTVLMIADQMLARIEYIHHKHMIHRDIKPDNFLFGVSDKAAQLFLIDFGLAKQYRDESTRQHIAYTEGKSLTGTARYASVNAHMGIEQSRRDDLESIGYILVYLNRGSLPWQGLKAPNIKSKYEKISQTKMGTTVERLTEGLPCEFFKYLVHVKKLRFVAKPDYRYLRSLFRELFGREGFVHDAAYDWTSVEPRAADETGQWIAAPLRPAE